MILFFDTETTGFFNDHLPVDDPAQPHLIQLAAQLCNDKNQIVSQFSLIVDPGLAVIIPEQASKVHGITTLIARQFGISPRLALTLFSHLYQRADCLCGHNVEFDRHIIEVAIARHNSTQSKLEKPVFCTMRATTDIVNLPPTEKMVAAGFNKPKRPKLAECIHHFFNEELSNAHDAMADVDACRRIYFHLKERQLS